MAAPILALRGARLVDGPRLLFDGVDLSLQANDRACLVGRNGAGKSTLLRILAGLIAPDSGERFAAPGLRIALVEQEPAVAGRDLTDYACSGGAPRHRAQAALAQFDLGPDRSTRGLSGGEARRAALARALAEQPDVLLLDEPTNHLDIVGIERLEFNLARSRAAILVVSHDRAFLGRVTSRCYWLESRRVRRRDAGFGGFEAWAEAIAAVEAESDRRVDRRIEREQDWMAHGVTARRARNQGRRRRLLALRDEKAERLRHVRGGLDLGQASVASASGRRVIQANAIAKSFSGRDLVERFSARILRGERVAIVGPNGAGKTTLVKMLLGELAPDSGDVQMGSNLAVAYVDQAREDLAATMSLSEALAPFGGDQVTVRGRPRHVAAYARDFGFRDDQLRQPVASLSGGERNRLLLARALARPANLLVLDEPTNDLDLETLDLLEDTLADYDGTLILVSHDRDFIDRLATSTIALDGRGHVVETPGGWSDFLTQNPDFLRRGPAPPGPPAENGPSRRQNIPAKLSFRETRRLADLERRINDLPAQIARLERLLEDPGLYVRDAGSFEAASKLLAFSRAELSDAERDWLMLEERREFLASQAGKSPGQ